MTYLISKKYKNNIPIRFYNKFQNSVQLGIYRSICFVFLNSMIRYNPFSKYVRTIRWILLSEKMILRTVPYYCWLLCSFVEKIILFDERFIHQHIEIPLKLLYFLYDTVLVPYVCNDLKKSKKSIISLTYVR